MISDILLIVGLGLVFGAFGWSLWGSPFRDPEGVFIVGIVVILVACIFKLVGL